VHPDTTARLIAEKFQAAWGKPVVVESIAGAGGNLAADRVAKSPPDGYTLLLAGITYGHGGAGISQHLAGELFNHMGGVAIRPVGFRGTTGVMPDLLAGRIHMCFCNIVTVLPLAQEGKLRALAVTSLKRSPTAPDLPTMDEAGFKGFDATAWFGLMAPAGTSEAIVGKLHGAVVKALASVDVAAKFNALGMVAIGNTPAEFTTVIQAEIPYWERVIKTIGLKLK
jgi:tripartite-type tricarboxylate transporter receptor subunit TctC